MNKEAVKRWTNELRSTDKKQGTGALHRFEGRIGECFCCLGIACDLFKDELNLTVNKEGYPITYNTMAGLLPREVCDFLELAEDTMDGGKEGDVLLDSPNLILRDGSNLRDYDYSLSLLNDKLGLSFSQIADMIDYFGVQ